MPATRTPKARAQTPKSSPRSRKQSKRELSPARPTNSRNKASYGSGRLPTRTFPILTERSPALLRASRTYPPRPDTLSPASPSFTRLREVLSRAALEQSQWEYDYQGDVTTYWEDRYLTEVFSALSAVIQEHGHGEEGWKSARWEVYDRYCQCFEGAGLEFLSVLKGAHVLTARRDNMIPAGLRYNSTLLEWDWLSFGIMGRVICV
ncbi:hypothetical protein B0H17DRAFT_1215177 [Mycena rosella]|uniref:Uncharacterized protein n=1 Tax=Mycena rosella TaxID=1033263 RepID=A0AAD7FZN0_MYCRO|nr:hypothetical protein B0H17DRAFT_1215177 [Mycena rosella]